MITAVSVPRSLSTAGSNASRSSGSTRVSALLSTLSIISRIAPRAFWSSRFDCAILFSIKSLLLLVRAPGSCGDSAGAIPLSDNRILAALALVVKLLSVYNLCMGKSMRINGQRLRELRTERALTLRALGEESGVAFDTINKLELGRRPAHASTIRKLASTLGVAPTVLMKGENDG